jgi:hypothetical protein
VSRRAALSGLCHYTIGFFQIFHLSRIKASVSYKPSVSYKTSLSQTIFSLSKAFVALLLRCHHTAVILSTHCYNRTWGWGERRCRRGRHARNGPGYPALPRHGSEINTNTDRELTLAMNVACSACMHVVTLSSPLTAFQVQRAQQAGDEGMLQKLMRSYTVSALDSASGGRHKVKKHYHALFSPSSLSFNTLSSASPPPAASFTPMPPRRSAPLLTLRL